MTSISYSDARKDLATTLDRVVQDAEPILITRKSRGNAVLLSEAEWRSLSETAHLLRSPANAARLMKAITETQQGKFEPRSLVEA